MTGYIFACYVRTFVPHWMEAVWLGVHSKTGYGNIHSRAYGEHVLWSSMNLAWRPSFGVDNVLVVNMVEEHPNLVEDVNSWVFGACRLFLWCFWTRMMFLGKTHLPWRISGLQMLLQRIWCMPTFSMISSTWFVNFICMFVFNNWMCVKLNCFWRSWMLHDVCGEALFVFAGNGREMFLECEYGEFKHLWIHPTGLSVDGHQHACLHAAAAFFNRRDSKNRRGTNSAWSMCTTDNSLLSLASFPVRKKGLRVRSEAAEFGFLFLFFNIARREHADPIAQIRLRRD